MTKLFLPQATLEAWLMNEQADLKDGQLVMTGAEARFPATPAVHFKQLVSGADEKGLLHRVKTEAQVEKLGGEHMADSVILGETAYEVEEGFVAEVELNPVNQPVKSPPAKSPPANRTAMSQDAQMLADLLLNKLP